MSQTAVAQTKAEKQSQLKIGERAGKFELSGSGLSLRATGKVHKQLGAADSNPLALPSQRLTPSQGRTDAFAVVDKSGKTVDTVLDRTVEVTQNGSERTAWVRTSHAVAIEWPSSEGVSKWAVKKPNGESIDTGESTFVDNGSPESGTYLISGTSNDGAVKSYVLTIPDAPSLREVFRSDKPPAEQAAVEPEQWRGFTWAAFIAEDKIQAKVGPFDGCTEAADGYYYYGGDDRTYAGSVQSLYNGTEPRFRIGSGVASTWKYPAWVNPSIYDSLIGKAAGLTTAYDSSGALLDSARADADRDIKLVRGTSEILPPQLGGLGLATREVKMSSANPLCSLPGDTDAPTIDVEYTYRHTSNGWVTVQGRHDKAPMHEAFWASSPDEDDPNKPNGCLYRFKNQGFTWLAAPLELGADVTMDFNPDSKAPTCVTVNS